MRVQPADVFNSALSLFGAWTLWQNLRRLIADRRVRGVDWRNGAYTSAKGWWNVVYCTMLGQPISAVIAGVLALLCSVWLALALRWRRV